MSTAQLTVRCCVAPGAALRRLRLSKGEVLRSHHLRVACFTQHHMDQLNLDQSPLEHLLEHGRIAEPTITPEEVRVTAPPLPPPASTHWYLPHCIAFVCYIIIITYETCAAASIMYIYMYVHVCCHIKTIE